MASLDEMEQALAVRAKVSDVVVVEDEDDDLREDFFEAVSLLSKCKTMMDFAADPDLCKSLSKRERESMERVSGQLKSFLDAVEGVYDGVEEF